MSLSLEHLTLMTSSRYFLPIVKEEHLITSWIFFYFFS